MFKKINRKNFLLMLLGVLLIGTGIAGYRLSYFGTDAFTCMNLGISGYIKISFGTWQLLISIALLILVFFAARSNIGIGTIINMVSTGYIADFICWLIRSYFHITPGIPARILFLAVGVCCCASGIAITMIADLGLAPYDSIAPVIHQLSRGKISFRMGRVLSDVTCLVIGILFCIAGHNSLYEIIGIGTLINAFFNGPLIQFIKDSLLKRLGTATAG